MKRRPRVDVPVTAELSTRALAGGQAVAGDAALLGDIGATNARFALLASGVLGPVSWIEVAQYPNFEDAVDALLKSQFHGVEVSRAVLAVAGPVESGRCTFTNCSWTVDARDIRTRFAFKAVRVVNDFEATALALPHLGDEDLYRVGEGRAVLHAAKAVLGPGSGLGVAGLVGEEGRWIVVPSEGGHATMAATTAREDTILAHLRERFGHVSAERVLSGPGLENLYKAIAATEGVQAPLGTPLEITNAALEASCPTACAALDMFCAMLGSFAGNVALAYGARGGVYIAGGIAPRILRYLSSSTFRQRFEQKGRMKPYLEAIPTQIIVHPTATFLGLRSLAEADPASGRH
jgi:glucokinase